MGATLRGYWDEVSFDPFLNLPLWLQAEFRGHIFWAWNRKHLAYLEAYIAAKHRPAKSKKRTQSFGSKLPEWMLSAKNGEDLVRLIQKLKMKM